MNKQQIQFKMEIDFWLPEYFAEYPKEKLGLILDDVRKELTKMSCVCSIFCNISAFLKDDDYRRIKTKYENITSAMTEFVNDAAPTGLKELTKIMKGETNA